MLKETYIKTTAIPRETSSTALPDWMSFPMLAEVFDQSPSKTISRLTAKHKEYQSQEVTGTAADRVRARLISASYLRTCALLQELEIQIELNKKQSTASAKR
ncbi:hypothetical protein [Edaphobacter aggregans]|uniref:hypothetical protein n=1 Tax=Edaphobacter aggregans TaxID=570835 RepID=UPI0012FBB816|nr:hypothetical protein [Edaphobacter aggregans]